MKELKQVCRISLLMALGAFGLQGLSAQEVEEIGTEHRQGFLSDVVLWQDASLTYLYGKQFEVDASEQQTATVEHASNLSFGDTFLFVDFIDYRDSSEDSSYYGEFSPRLSASKFAGVDASFGLIKDVLIASTYEFGKGDVESLLYGLGLDLDLPGFDYFQLNLYYRDPQNNNSRGWQLTPVFSYTMPVGVSEVVIDGFIDYVFASENGDYEENLHINPQIKYNLGKLLWGDEHRLYIGVEYDYWSDKYGIKDSSAFKTDQSAYSFLLQYYL